MDKDTFFKKKKSLRFRDKIFILNKPIIMGILNITPDSFYIGSRIQQTDKAIATVETMIENGATIIDIGAASTRPGAELISPEEERNRLKPILHELSKAFPEVWFSIDTYHADIAKMCVEEYGFYMINDISAYSIDPKMYRTIIELNVPYVLMHMQGNPQNMQKNPHYDNVENEIFQFLGKKIYELTAEGLNDIIVDPGFGFGKSLQHNYQLLKNLNYFKALNCPILVGLSRKSMVYKLLETTPEKALNGTVVLQTLAMLNGADIIRTHDVKETNEIITLLDYYWNA
ncbi:MAG: dihydropteroate synthase [Bacteroidales bacterium]